MLVRVLSVRAQDRRGAIFRGQRISESGEILDANRDIVARVHAGAVGVKVRKGQWWRISGEVGIRTFVNASGFEMAEDHVEVRPGGAALQLPSGAHIVEYIARNDRFEGIGPLTAQKLWETFREGLVEVLDAEDYTALVDVIAPAKAKVLIEGWREEGLSKTLQWLQSHEIGLAIGRRILGYFGAEAHEKINENPYRLLSFAAGWDEVDRLATSALGVQPLDERRLAAAVEESVYQQFALGHTFVPRKDLVSSIKRLLKNEPRMSDMIESALKLCERTGRVLFDSQDNAYSLGASILENRIVDCIDARRGMVSPACDVRAIIRAFETQRGKWPLSDEQRAAVHLIAEHHFSVVTGGAGCGKTTVLTVVCDVLEAQGYDVIQLALAGKAVKRMQESTGRPAKTLASFIKKLNEEPEGQQDLKEQAILIDEASMVDLLSFSALARGVDDRVKIALIGDPHQLPPIGPGLVLQCLTDGIVPHVELKAPQRFGSEIAAVADSIKAGVLPRLSETGKVRLLETSDNELADVATELYLTGSAETVVLCATRALAKRINEAVQTKLSTDREELRVWNQEFDCWEASGLREGDLVICTDNHWDLGLQNGSIGRIVSLKKDGEALGAIEWDDGQTRTFDASFLDSLELAYALTVHKAQGSQWHRVIVCLPSTRSSSVDRSLIYTALTRAQSEVILLGSAAAMAQTVAREKAADRRRVGLPKRLAQLRHDGPTPS